MRVLTIGLQAGANRHGDLQPWNGHWYWSGKQAVYDEPVEEIQEKVITHYLANTTSAHYHFCPDLADTASNPVRLQHISYKEYYGDELVVFEDGLTLAATEKKRLKKEWAKRPKKEIRQTMKKHGLKRPEPAMSFPGKLLEQEGGIAMFFDPAEGQSFFTSFNELSQALAQEGRDHTENQREIISALFTDKGTSPAFVRRILKDGGIKSVKSVFLLSNHPSDLVQEYLLRREKGKYFKRQYPNILLV